MRFEGVCDSLGDTVASASEPLAQACGPVPPLGHRAGARCSDGGSPPILSRTRVEAKRKRSFQRRAGIYLIVLASAVLVTVIGLSALTAQRIELRSAGEDGRILHARRYARSAIEIGLWTIENDSSWRSRTNGAWISNAAIGEGTCSLDVVDPGDGDLGDGDHDPVVLTGTGVLGNARHRMQVTLQAQAAPFDILRTGLHAGGAIIVNSKMSLSLLGGPLSSNTIITNSGTILGDVEALAVVNLGTIAGSVTALAPAKTMPASTVFAEYAAKATAIPFSGGVTKIALGPGYNPWGAPNAEGLYLLDTGGSNVAIDNSLIYGTLLVRCGAGNTVTVKNAMFVHPVRADYPALMVDGNLSLEIISAAAQLSEPSSKVNFNPAGVPYEGETDADQLDVYPNEIDGLIYVTGNLNLRQTARVQGTIVCRQNATINGANVIRHDPNLYANPPEGFGTVTMVPAAGSWKQIVD